MTNGTPGAGGFQGTTISERWNAYISGLNGGYSGSPNSFNHYAFGAVGEWIYKVVGGINPDDTNPGYQNTIFNPQPGGGISNAYASLNSIHGLTSVCWTNTGTATNYYLTVPANATACLYVPSTSLVNITESGNPSTNAVGVISFQLTNNSTLFRVGSGTYNFRLSGP